MRRTQIVDYALFIAILVLMAWAGLYGLHKEDHARCWEDQPCWKNRPTTMLCITDSQCEESHGH